MDLSIVILNYNSRGLVKNCIKSILESAINREYEIIVVDNNSRENIEQMLKENFPRVKLICHQKNIGFGSGTNVGIREAVGQHVLVINPDIFVLPNAIAQLVDYAETNKGVGLVGPRLLNPDRTLQKNCYRWHRVWTPIFRRTFLEFLPLAKRELARFLMDDWDHASTREVDWIQGSCLLIPKKVLDTVGLFDERFFMYFEDTDLCRRIKRAGLKNVYLADAEVIHLHRRQSADGGLLRSLFNRLTWIHGVSWLKYMYKWRGEETGL
ncbi:MAG: glycosyltransferase family 2 protein [Parcubacteria group bacterium]